MECVGKSSPMYLSDNRSIINFEICNTNAVDIPKYVIKKCDFIKSGN